jgi:cell division protein FtsQ
MKIFWLKRWSVVALVALLIPAMGFAVFFSLNEKGFFKVVEIAWDVHSSKVESPYYEDHLNQLQFYLQKFVGTSMWSVNLDTVASVLKTQDWIADHQVRKSWPSRLSVEIIPKKIAFILVKPGKGYRPLTEDGDLLSLTDNLKLPDKMLLFGDAFERDSVLRSKALDLYRALPADGTLERSMISEVRYGTKKGFQLSLIGSSTLIHLGEQNFEQKISRVTQVLQYLENKKLQARVIDANLTKKVLVRLQ